LKWEKDQPEVRYSKSKSDAQCISLFAAFLVSSNNQEAEIEQIQTKTLPCMYNQSNFHEIPIAQKSDFHPSYGRRYQ